MQRDISPELSALEKNAKRALRDPSARVFKDIPKYEHLLGKAGIGNDTNVIIYGEHKITDSFKDTTVAFWLLEYLGHNKAHVLNGGLDAWEKAGHKLTNTPTIKPAKTFKAKVVKNRYASTEEVLQIAKGTKNLTLIDARSKKNMRAKTSGRSGAVIYQKQPLIYPTQIQWIS